MDVTKVGKIIGINDDGVMIHKYLDVEIIGLKPIRWSLIGINTRAKEPSVGFGCYKS